MPYAFTGPQKIVMRGNAPLPHNSAGKSPPWESEQERGNVTFKRNTVHKGLTYKLYTSNDEPKETEKAKIKVLHAAIEALQGAGIMFSNADVKEFRVTIYGSTGYYGKFNSRGVVWFDNPADAKPTVLLQLGSRITTHFIGDHSTSVGAGGHISGAGKGQAPRIVADRIYDYYKPTLTVSAKDRCGMVQALHEFGHIFHQLLAPKEYWIGADVFMGQARANSWTGDHVTANGRVDAMKTVGRKHVSQYAACGQINEYVAEVFSGLVMGVPWDQIHADVMTTYGHFGGPIPATPRTISRLDAFTTGRCACTGGIDNNCFKVYYGKWK